MSDSPSTVITDADATLRIRYMSDLHLDLAPFTPPAVLADVVVLAGDIHEGVAGMEWAARVFPETPVLYVPGNHEYYSHDVPTLFGQLIERAAQLGIVFLHNRELVIGGIRFIGSTLWTDFALTGDTEGCMLSASTGMNDFVQIRHGERPLHPVDTAALHHIGRQFLTHALDQPFHGRTVVVTHHAPSGRSLPPATRHAPLAAAYASDLELLVTKADVWIHGHVHTCVQYQIGRCQVLCNPRGYQSEFYRQETGFDASAVVTV